MHKVRLGRTEVSVPSIGVGTWAHGGPLKVGEEEVGWGGQDDEMSANALIRAHGVGLIHWDTADVYGAGHSEKIIGKLWGKVPRDEIFLASKVGWDPGEYEHFYHPKLIRQKIEESLRNLRVDHIDLYYLHHCNFGDNAEYLDDAAELIFRFKEEGKIRFVGLSDWDSAAVRSHIEKVDPDVVQICRNVRNPSYEGSGLKSYVEEHDIGAVFFSALDYGLLLGKYTEPTTFDEGDSRNRVEGLQDQKVLDHMLRARKEVEAKFSDHPQPLLHALVGSLLADSPTGSVLVGQRNPKQVDAAALATASLSEEDARWVVGLYSDD